MDQPAGAFTTEHVAKLTGLSKRQLAYWDTTNFFSPSLSRGGDHRPYGRIYSFQDVVALRTLAKLRKRVSLTALRTLGAWLKQHYDHPWSRLRFYVTGDQIVYTDPESGALISSKPLGQTVLPFEVEPVANEMHAAVCKLRERRPSDIGRVTRHRYVVHNEPVVAGTRIPTWMIWELHVAGYDDQAITQEYPSLLLPDVRAAIEYERNARLAQVG